MFIMVTTQISWCSQDPMSSQMDQGSATVFFTVGATAGVCVCCICVCVSICHCLCVYVCMSVEFLLFSTKIKMSLTRTVAMLRPMSIRRICTHSMSRREGMPSDKLTVNWKKLYLFVGKVNVTFYIRLEYYEDRQFYQFTESIKLLVC